MSYAHQVDGIMSERDFDLLVKFQDSSYRRNTVMTPVVRDMLDDSISGYDWAVRHYRSIARLDDYASEQEILASQISDVSLRRHLVQFAELTRRQANAFSNLRRAFLSNNQAAASTHWDEVALGGRMRAQMGAPIYARLRERLGADFVDRHLESYLASLARGVTPR